MWYSIKLPGFSYDFETDRYNSEAEARNHIRELWAPKDTGKMLDYMRALEIKPLYERLTKTPKGAKMDYAELLRITGNKLEEVKGSYDRLAFGEQIDAYHEISKLYADFLGLDPSMVGVLSYLLQSVVMAR